MLDGAIWAEKTAQAKAQKYEITWCVLGAIQVIQHGLEQKIQGRVQRHLGNEKGMLCDPGLPHSMLGK